MNMAIDRITACLTPELGATLRRLAKQRGESISATIEVLLREHPAIRQAVQTQRSVTKKDRDVQKLLAIGDAARANWERAEAAGQVRIRGR